MDKAWHRIECQGVFATVMPIPDAIGVRERHGRSDDGMPRATASTATPGTNGVAARGDLGVPMASGEERDDQDDAPKRTEDLMREAPPPSVLGDVEDAVAPDDEEDLTPWSPPGRDEEDDA
jgi:hypothetical protein